MLVFKRCILCLMLFSIKSKCLRVHSEVAEKSIRVLSHLIHSVSNTGLFSVFVERMYPLPGWLSQFN